MHCMHGVDRFSCLRCVFSDKPPPKNLKGAPIHHSSNPDRVEVLTHNPHNHAHSPPTAHGHVTPAAHGHGNPANMQHHPPTKSGVHREEPDMVSEPVGNKHKDHHQKVKRGSDSDHGKHGKHDKHDSHDKHNGHGKHDTNEKGHGKHDSHDKHNGHGKHDSHDKGHDKHHKPHGHH